MWADTLQSYETRHLLLLIGWGAGSVLTGILLFVFLSLRHFRAPLLTQLGVQFALWGSAALLWGVFASNDVPLRDYEGAVELSRELWIAVGVEASGILVGLTLAIAGWTFVRRLGLVGTGIGITVQSSALIILDLVFLRAIRL